MNNKLNYLSVLFSMLVFTSCANKPNLRFLAEEVDLGVVLPGERKLVTNQIKNVGKEVLIIADVAGGCNCINVKVSLDTIQPGKTAVVNVTYEAPSKLDHDYEIILPVIVRSNSENKLDEFYLKGTQKNKK